MFSPTTNLRLLSTPLESDYGNTLWFPNIAAQTAYFTSKTVKTYANFNYIKKDNTIVVPDEVDNLYNCNYIMYQNSNFGTRWFYAFINRMEWASNGSTDCMSALMLFRRGSLISPTIRVMWIDAILILTLLVTILFRNLLPLGMPVVISKLVRKTCLQTGFLFMQLPNMTEALHQP